MYMGVCIPLSRLLLPGASQLLPFRAIGVGKEEEEEGEGEEGRGPWTMRADRESQETWMRLSHSFVAQCHAPHLLLLPSPQCLLSPHIRLSSFFCLSCPPVSSSTTSTSPPNAFSPLPNSPGFRLPVSMLHWPLRTWYSPLSNLVCLQ